MNRCKVGVQRFFRGRPMRLGLPKYQPTTSIIRLRLPQRLHLSTSPTMSAIQRSIRSRLLPTASRPTARLAAVPKHWYYINEPSRKASSNNAPAAKPGDSAIIRQEGAAGGQPRHRPDYNVAIDYRTS